MSDPKPSFSVNVDPTNPGQFFACCGLLELADRLWSGAEGWFADGQFHVACGNSLRDLLSAARDVRFTEESEGDDDDDDEDDENAPVVPLIIESPIQICLDWWADRSIKTWAGSMQVQLVALAMCRSIDIDCADPLNQTQIVYDPQKAVPAGQKARKTKPKKREPFYFDARRGPNAHSRDVGFAPNDIQMKTEAAPAVEFLCLVGLQRCRPVATEQPRVFNYFSWSEPLAPVLLPAAVSGLMPHLGASGYRFENWFRTGQKKHKAFRSAVPHSQQGAQ